MNDLERYFSQNTGRLIHKWNHYFEIYERHFNRFRGKEVTILEIGVFHGGSLQMWKNYFGSKARIFGIDMNPKCKDLEEENIKIFIGSQADRKFLRSVKDQIPDLDILIDDGGHRMQQQIITFEELFDKVRNDGVYVCEDLLTSYQLTYGGGHKRRGTFIEYSKDLIDSINAYHSEQRSLKVNSFTRSADSLHFYDSMLVIEKRPREKPYHTKTGRLSYTNEQKGETAFQKIKFRIVYAINLMLRFFRLPGYKW